MKYIDADKLKAELKGFRNIARERINDEDCYFLGIAQGYDNAIDIITSLQQEQEVELKKEIEKVWEAFPPKFLDYTAFAELVTHFYELGLNARKEE